MKHSTLRLALSLAALCALAAAPAPARLAYTAGGSAYIDREGNFVWQPGR